MTYPIFSSGFAGKPLLPFRTLLNFFLLCVKPSPALPDSCHPYTTTPSSNSLHPTVSEPFVYIYSCTSPIRLLFLICICVSPLRVRCPYLPFCRAQQWTVSKIPNWRAMADMFHLAGTPHGEKKMNVFEQWVYLLSPTFSSSLPWPWRALSSANFLFSIVKSKWLNTPSKEDYEPLKYH